MESVFYTRHDNGLTMFRDGKMATVSATHVNFNAILVALKQKKYELVESLMSIKETINKFGKSRRLKGRNVFVENGKVYWNDSKNVKRELHGSLVERILEDLGSPAGVKFGDALIAFLDNIQKNKLKDIRQELYEFLLSGKTPITYDGCFLAYKRVGRDFKDIYTGTMDNSPGNIVRMKQDLVDRDRTNHCSVGLHFCSKDYLSSYANGDHVMIVKVNPRHVFAIPNDYHNQKGRASEYFVVGEYKPGGKAYTDRQVPDAFTSWFIDEDSKVKDAPDVEFATGWMRPSLEKIAESYGLLKNGLVSCVYKNSGKYLPVRVDDKGFLFDITGTPVDADEYYELSVKTKSVRAALKAAIARIS
jgi:hypothetical protein